MATEFELKYAATAAQLKSIQAALPGAYTSISMETTYYDTPAHALSSRKWTLRRRFENGVSVCTLKTPAGNLERNEWEVECESIEEALPELCKLSCLSNLRELTANGVIPVCGARFTRLACQIDTEHTVVELALDQGVLFASEKEIPLFEVEVEHKAGSVESTDALGKQLADIYDLTPEAKSKFARALALCEE